MPKFLRIGIHQSNVSGYTSKAWCVRRVGTAILLKWGAVEVEGAGDGRKVYWSRLPQEKTIRCGSAQRAQDYAKAAIARHGGEILKFIGDGLLAIFPLSEPNACANLLHAVTEARQAMIALNERNNGTGRAPLNYGIGVHVGDVMYGNIGSRARLDFTVIGPAVNMASRLEALTKQLGRTVLLSRAFADFVESDFDLERVGEYPVRGFNDPIELFAYHG